MIMDSGRRSFVGTLLAFLLAPLMMGGCQMPRKRNRRLAGKTIKVTRTVSKDFGIETITIDGDDESLKVFSEDWGINVKEYVPYTSMNTGEYEKGGAFYLRLPGAKSLNVLYYTPEAQLFGAFGAPTRKEYAATKADGAATATADVARSIARCRQEGADVIDHEVVEFPRVKVNTLVA